MRAAFTSLWNMFIALFGAGEELAEGIRDGAKIIRAEIQHTGKEMAEDRAKSEAAIAKIINGTSTDTTQPSA